MAPKDIKPHTPKQKTIKRKTYVRGSLKTKTKPISFKQREFLR